MGLLCSRRSKGRSRSVGLIILAAAGLAGCAGEARQSAAAPLLPVLTVAVEPLAGSGMVSGVGRVAYEREAVLSFRTPGVLRTLAVDVGDQVAKGALIAALEGSDTRARLAEADAVLNRQTQAMRRYDSLAESGAVARALVEDQRMLVAEARSARVGAAYDDRSSRLAAPTAGVVLERTAQVGETLSAGQSVVRIGDTGSRLIVRAPLPAGQAIQIRPGATAHVTLLGGAVSSGRVTRISSQAGADTGAIQVEIALDPAARAVLASGMTVRVSIDLPGPAAAQTDLVRAPAEAVVVERGGAAFVFAVDAKGVARRRPVAVVRYDGDDAVITGVARSTRVITAGAGFVTDGQRVSVAQGAAR